MTTTILYSKKYLTFLCFTFILFIINFVSNRKAPKIVEV